MPCRILFGKLEDLETWSNHLNFCFLTRVRSSSYSSTAAWIFMRTSSLVAWSLSEMFNSRRHRLISKARPHNPSFGVQTKRRKSTSRHRGYSKACVRFLNLQFAGIKKYRNDKGAHHFHPCSKRYAFISSNCRQPC